MTHFSVDVETHYDLLKYRLRERLGGRNPIMILPYRGYGTPDRIFLRGRVLEDRGITPPTEDDTVWENLVNMWRRAKSVEIPNAQVRARYGGEEQVVTADVEGFFEVWIEPAEPLPTDRLWREIELELVAPIARRRRALPARPVQILVPLPDAEFVVISDVDDTVLQTDATQPAAHGPRHLPGQRPHPAAVRRRRRVLPRAARRAAAAKRSTPCSTSPVRPGTCTTC